MGDFLFDDFPEVSEKQWKQKIQYELNGQNYNDTLVTHSIDDISVKPFYHLDSYKQFDHSKKEIDFKICQSIFIHDSNIANSIAQNAISKGATSIFFKAIKPFEIDTILARIQPNIELHFEFEFMSKSFIDDLIFKTKKFKTFIHIDIIGNLCKSGNWFYSFQKDIEIFSEINTRHRSNLTTASINASLYQNSGATIVQQVAYALLHGNEYLNLDLKSLDITVLFSVGSNYFFEIAKIRAFRYLWNLITKDAGIESNLHILTTPSQRNKTLYDYNTNTIRTTSECMSAILGGSNTISNVSHDSLYHKSNEFGERIARNQILILKDESYFQNKNLAIDGSYYVESITKDIIEKSLSIFKEIEKNGGFLKQLKGGIIQRKIKESAGKEQQQFDSKEIVLVGTNKYQNSQDKMKGDLELYPFVKINPRKTLIQPIIPSRISEKLEKERLKNEA